VSSEKLCILAYWFLSKNSVLEELNIRTKICNHPGRDLLKSVSRARNALVKVERAEREELSVICMKWWSREREEIRVLRGLVYMSKSRGPRTEPWGTPQEDV